MYNVSKKLFVNNLMMSIDDKYGELCAIMTCIGAKLIKPSPSRDHQSQIRFNVYYRYSSVGPVRNVLGIRPTKAAFTNWCRCVVGDFWFCVKCDLAENWLKA